MPQRIKNLSFFYGTAEHSLWGFEMYVFYRFKCEFIMSSRVLHSISSFGFSFFERTRRFNASLDFLLELFIKRVCPFFSAHNVEIFCPLRKSAIGFRLKFKVGFSNPKVAIFCQSCVLTLRKLALDFGRKTSPCFLGVRTGQFGQLGSEHFHTFLQLPRKLGSKFEV